jgi:molybdopterin-guanine dinucleotide biosynthesis protein B
MRVFGIAGHSGMGKTTLLEAVLPELKARGLTVFLIKHSHKDLDIDHPGKDSYRLREAGCQELLLMGRRRWALMLEMREEGEPLLAHTLSKFKACDWC